MPSYCVTKNGVYTENLRKIQRLAGLGNRSERRNGNFEEKEDLEKVKKVDKFVSIKLNLQT